ncbi:NADP-dependent oxidoreductase domain-containing protein [Myxozyma melibiosi]|uniref:NADP-dependent oxidoreductase domain-containing protein n=1 Tax=Myxozyma melibiosi TaxID=54550 RepID=A0ABR1F6G8_9ASCO
MPQHFLLRPPISTPSPSSKATTLPPTRMPRMIYGTAWKKTTTAKLVHQALCAGFRAIDTACQPRHYNEAQVGAGVRAFLREQEGKVGRRELYLQTKFTPEGGQDPATIPYDPLLAPAEQVAASIKVSLQNLGVEYIDTLVLHSPFPNFKDTVEAWRAMFSYTPYSPTSSTSSPVHNIGLSNIDLPTLTALVSETGIYPSVIQNRFYADTAFDVPLRRWCVANDVIYQSFWTLSANPHLLRSKRVREIAAQFDLPSLATALYAAVLSERNLAVLNGTTSESHMEEDLQVVERNLLEDSEEISKMLNVT